jgi:hypothetical protein
MPLITFQTIAPTVLCLTGIFLFVSILILVSLKNDIRNWLDRLNGRQKKDSLKSKNDDQLILNRNTKTKVRESSNERKFTSLILVFFYSMLLSLIGILILASEWIWLVTVVPLYFATMLFLLFEKDIADFFLRLILVNDKQPVKKTRKVVRRDTIGVSTGNISGNVLSTRSPELTRKKTKKPVIKRLLPLWLIYILTSLIVTLSIYLVSVIYRSGSATTPYWLTEYVVSSTSASTINIQSFEKLTTTPFPTTIIATSVKSPHPTSRVPTIANTKTPSVTPSFLPATQTIAASATPIPLPTSPSPNIIIQLYEEIRMDARLWILTTVMWLFAAYILGMIALVFGAWKNGSVVFSRSFLSNLASKPLLITPKFASWALFLGYKQRLLNQLDVDPLKDDFFGLPAIDPQGNFINYDSNGSQLNQLIGNALDYQVPVIITAPGGGGKTTLIERWIYLIINQKAILPFRTFIPIYVTPAYYSGDTLDAIVGVLKERDGVAVTRETAQAQLETGKYLILFDGITEIDGDKNIGLKDILRFAQNAEFRSSRFLISSRPGLNFPPDIPVFHLQPLTSDIIRRLYQKFSLSSEQQLQVNKQLQLFGSKPIEPLLFTMILAQGEDTKNINTKAQLYEKYFKRLLRIEKDNQWRGWEAALQDIARWSMLDTGSRGLGLLHETLFERMFEKQGNDGVDFIKRINKIYKLGVLDESDLLEKLESAGILYESRRWRFVHDTFEEYFSACYIVAYLIKNKAFPELSLWTYDETQIQSFVTVIEFVYEMIDDGMSKVVRNLKIPDLWKTILLQKSEDREN